MSAELNTAARSSFKIAIIPLLAALVALVGLADSIYLTVHHYTAEPVPCTITGDGCEFVLTSSYSMLFGIPIAIFGAAGYLAAFLLALATAFGFRSLWKLFVAQATIMALVSAYLLYVQGVVLEHFCQYCLLSALTSFTLFVLAMISLAVFRRR